MKYPHTRPIPSETHAGFNLFAYCHGEAIYALGAVRHDEPIDEQSMLARLQEAVPRDALTARHVGVKRSDLTFELEDGSPAIPSHVTVPRPF